MLRENFYILLITIIAERRRSFDRWSPSVSFAVKMVSINEIVVPMTIINICFQKPPILGLMLTLGGLMGIFAIFYCVIVFLSMMCLVWLIVG